MKINWKQIPLPVQATVWSWNAIPLDYDRQFQIVQVEVEPLYSELQSTFSSAGVYEDDLDHLGEQDLDYPIMIDKRLQGQADIADGLHRIMKAHLLGRATIPAIDLTPMFIELGLVKASNEYPTAPGKEALVDEFRNEE